jgi:hypothetical protein
VKTSVRRDCSQGARLDSDGLAGWRARDITPSGIESGSFRCSEASVWYAESISGGSQVSLSGPNRVG